MSEDRPASPKDMDGTVKREAATQRTTQVFSKDNREVRRRNGTVGWKLEQGAPDGFRTRQGHAVKNQGYYVGPPKTHLWDNPSHAGPKTWRTWHGPKLRAAADLMEQDDREDKQVADQEAKKAYVNNTRVKTLDRFYQKRIENEQKEKAGSWAPHRRARREVHDLFSSCAAELDSMPARELKMMMTDQVLKSDREGIRQICKRIQQEEDSKMARRRMEKERREELRQGFELRAQYNDMLMQMSGQQPTREPRTAPVSARQLEELAQPRQSRPLPNITQLSDFRGMLHVDHQFALESLFPGAGHDLAEEAMRDATRSARATASQQRQKKQPPSPPRTPPATTTRRATIMEEGSLVQMGSVPVTQDKLSKVALRDDPREQARRASVQFQATAAPPAPPSVPQETSFFSDPAQMDHVMTSRSSPKAGSSTSRRRSSQIDIPPPLHPVVYPVAVGAADEAHSPKRASVVGQRSAALDEPGAASSLRAAGGQQLTPRRSELWPPVGSQVIDISVRTASGLPQATETSSGLYVACRIVGKPRAVAESAAGVAEAGEELQLNQDLTLQGWKLGDDLEVAICEQGGGKLATARLRSSKFFPDGFDGRLALESAEVAAKRKALSRQCSKATVGDDGSEPTRPRRAPAPASVDLRVAVQDAIETGGDMPPFALRREALMASHLQPTTSAVVHDLSHFEANLREQPVIGNFWMTPRGDARSRGGTAAAEARAASGR